MSSYRLDDGFAKRRFDVASNTVSVTFVFIRWAPRARLRFFGLLSFVCGGVIVVVPDGLLWGVLVGVRMIPGFHRNGLLFVCGGSVNFQCIFLCSV